MSNRLRGRFGYPKDDPFAVTVHEDRLEEPLRWKKPRRVFVCSMGDIFHPDVPMEFIVKMFQVMRSASQHTFQVLTKRLDRIVWPVDAIMPPNIWVGVTVEDQKRAQKRLPALVAFPSTVRFVSCEPLLEKVRLTKWIKGIDWVIAGAETGPVRRPMEDEWAKSLKVQCENFSVPFFFKRNSDGSRELEGEIIEEYPEP
jgi:protein gp37